MTCCVLCTPPRGTTLEVEAAPVRQSHRGFCEAESPRLQTCSVGERHSAAAPTGGGSSPGTVSAACSASVMAKAWSAASTAMNFCAMGASAATRAKPASAAIFSLMNFRKSAAVRPPL